MTVKNPPGADGVARYAFTPEHLVAGELEGEYVLTDTSNGRVTSRKEWSALVKRRIGS
jgi:hypothetical protein